MKVHASILNLPALWRFIHRKHEPAEHSSRVDITAFAPVRYFAPVQTGVLRRSFNLSSPPPDGPVVPPRAMFGPGTNSRGPG